MTITEFLEARIAEDEAAALRAAEVFPGVWDIEDRGHHAHVVSDGPNFHYVSEIDQRQAPGVWLGGALESIANFNPARVLAECAAKRAIVEEHGNSESLIHSPLCRTCHDYNDHDAVDWPCPTIKALAAVYASHPDYRQEWEV